MLELKQLSVAISAVQILRDVSLSVPDGAMVGLIGGTRLLLLDEPFEGVAPALAQRLAEVVADLKREGMAVLLSESDLQHSERMVDRVIVIDRGAIAS